MATAEDSGLIFQIADNPSGIVGFAAPVLPPQQDGVSLLPRVQTLVSVALDRPPISGRS